VRVIAATHRNLHSMVNEQTFRSDLFYRLAVLQVRIPPLRERREDLPLLVGHILGRLEAEPAEVERLSSPEFIADLARHRWAGNIRELRNYLERCLALGAHAELQPIIDGGDGLPEIDLSRPLKAARDVWLRPFERRYVQGLMDRHEGNVSAAARAAGIDRVTFYRLLWRLGLRDKE
jgi:DNA-binding NtrC family response regulator